MNTKRISIIARLKKMLRAAIQSKNNTERVEKSGAEWRCFDKTRQLVSKKKLSIRDKIYVGSGMLLHPNAIKRAVSYATSSKTGGKRRFSILAFSDRHGNLGEQMQWGDFWVKQELTAAITALGGIVVEPFMNPDTMIHLFGGYCDLPPAGEHVLWIHSHPEKLNHPLLASYDRVYCISKKESEAIQQSGVSCAWLPMATGKREQNGVSVKERVVFVGNALPNLGGHRRVVDDMLAVCAGNPNIEFSLWGGLYQDLPPGVLVDEYIPYHDLNALYASSAIVLNDHRPEMSEREFINPRILDVIASGGFVVSDRNTVISNYFGDTIPQYEGVEELKQIVNQYLGHPERRDEKMALARELVREYSWERVARG